MTLPTTATTTWSSARPVRTRTAVGSPSSRARPDGVYATTDNTSIDQSTKGIPGKSEKGDRFGATLGLLDHDQDGLLDLSVGAPGENSADGSVTTLNGDDGSTKAYSLELARVRATPRTRSSAPPCPEPCSYRTLVRTCVWRASCGWEYLSRP